LNLLQCTENELDILSENSDTIFKENKSIYDIVLKILQEGLNIREATLLGVILGQKYGYSVSKAEMEEEIKEKLYKAFRNTQ
jgi:hypothetical protein